MDERDITGITVVCGSAGAICGFLIGIVAGFVVSNGRRIATVLALALIGALMGAAGGTLSPCAVFHTDPRVPAIVSSSIAWGMVGLMVGGLAYPVSRWVKGTPEPKSNDDGSHDQPESTTWQSPSRRHKDALGPFVRAFPVLAASAFPLIVALVIPTGETTLILLALGVQGLALSHSFIQLDQRLGSLRGPSQT